MKKETLIRGELRAPIELGKPAIIHREDQTPDQVWLTTSVEKIVSVAIKNGKVGVKFETANTVYTAVLEVE